jgi:hypothetical protein
MPANLVRGVNLDAARIPSKELGVAQQKRAQVLILKNGRIQTNDATSCGGEPSKRSFVELRAATMAL